MIDIIYVQYNTTHENNFVYYEDDQTRDWWLLLMAHTPAFFIIEDKKYISCLRKALYYIHPMCHFTTAATKVILKMTGSVFIPTKNLSVMEKSPPVSLLRSRNLALSIIYLSSLPRKIFTKINTKPKPSSPCLS